MPKVNLQPEDQAAMCRRFGRLCDMYMDRESISSYAEFSEKIDVQYSHFIAVKNGTKAVSLDILLKSVRHCNFNANYILDGRGNHFSVSGGEYTQPLSKELKKIEKELGEIRIAVEVNGRKGR